MAASYEVALISRIPQASGFPTGAEINRLVADTISYTDELNRPGSATLSCPVGSLTDDIKLRLRNLATLPTEAWIYRNGVIKWIGEIQTLGLSGQTVTINAVGLLGYTFRMGVTADLVYTNVDQFTIAKGLVDHWQGLAYGHYGFETIGVGTSGVLRNRTYLRNELHNIGTRLAELAAVINGFDFHVPPATRTLVLSYPQRGIDLSGSVFLDRLNIDSASVAMSVGPDDIVSDLSATGTSQDTTGTGSTLYAERSTLAVRTSYGRSWAGQNYDGVSVAATLDGHGDAYLAARTGQLFQPGVTLVPRVGAEPGDFAPGDTVSYGYDAGLGEQTAPFRVAKIKVDVGKEGRERMGVEFA